MTIVSFFIGMIIGALAGFLAATLLATTARTNRETEAHRYTREYVAGAEIRPGEVVVSLGDQIFPAAYDPAAREKGAMTPDGFIGVVPVEEES